MTIHKYPLRVTDTQEIPMPFGAEILCVQVQHGTPCLWAIVKPSKLNPLQPKTIEVYGTGHDMPQDMGINRKYIGTFQMNSGSLVFHVFERV